MQNTSQMHHRQTPASCPLAVALADAGRHLRVYALIMGILALFVAVAAAAPAPALAKDYEMPRVDIAIDVADTGDVTFVEERQFDFDGSFTCVWWEFGDIPQNASILINGVSLKQGEADSLDGQQSHAIEEVPFQTQWRSSGGPGGEAYSWDEEEETLYVFFRASYESLDVTIDYTVVNGISAYDDMGEFYWQYITEGWAVDSDDVTATVTLPVPDGIGVSGGDNVYAWGHGPIDGEVRFNDDGTITYTVPEVPSGDFAEARVLFPVEWLTNLSASSKVLHEGESILPSALQEEQQWADEANFQRLQSRLFAGFFFALAVALVVWALVVFFRWGRELKPRFTGEYWRDAPDEELPPAVIGRLMRFGEEEQSDFTATLMNLSARGLVRIDKGSYADTRGKMVDDYYLTLRRDALGHEKLDVLERKAIEIVFDKVAEGRDQVWFKSIELYAKENAEEFADLMEKWQGALTAETNKAMLLEAKSEGKSHTIYGIAVVYAVVIFVVFDLLEDPFVLIPSVPATIALFVIGHFTTRRTQRGADVAAKADALKRWLKDFTRLDERPPTDVKVWGQFMVYAFLFGIADDVMRDLRMSVPTFRDSDDTSFSSSMPYYYWYVSGAGRDSAMGADAFDSTVTHAFNTAKGVVSAQSGGGGGGGGFSGGGGGGFGGGGGGGAR